MNRDVVFDLISRTGMATDEDGNQESTFTKRTVYGKEESIGQKEYFSAAATGLKPEKKITVFVGDYADEREAEVCGRVLDIYRTHFRNADERMELYMSEKAGS